MASVRVQIPVKAEPQESGIWIPINIQQKESGQTVDLWWNPMEKEGNVTIWASQVLRCWLLLFISIVLEHLRTLHLGEKKKGGGRFTSTRFRENLGGFRMGPGDVWVHEVKGGPDEAMQLLGLQQSL